MKSEIAAAFGLSGSLLEGARVAGRVVDVAFEIDHAEWARRQEREEGTVLDRDLLQLMSRFPYREVVRLRDLDAFTRALLVAKGEGLVMLTAHHVERIWKPVFEIQGFLVVSADWRRALRRVSLFVADGPRAVAYTGSEKLTEASRRAQEMGVGLARVQHGEIEVLVKPERHLVRNDHVRWALSEYLFSLFENRFART